MQTFLFFTIFWRSKPNSTGLQAILMTTAPIYVAWVDKPEYKYQKSLLGALKKQSHLCSNIL